MACRLTGSVKWTPLSRQKECCFIAWFVLEDQVREDAAEMVAALKALGIRVELLSGDTPQSAGELAEHLGIDSWQGSAGPEAKLERIRACQEAGETVAMVGDGINDVPVLAGADVSIAMNGATDLARTSADAVLLSPVSRVSSRPSRSAGPADASSART